MTLPDFSGRQIAQYRLSVPLSSGATSTVYSAVHSDRPGKYAIKCLSKFDLTPKQQLLRASEIFHHQLVTGCSPHVLPLQEIIDEDSYLFIVFNLCEGDLFQAIWHERLYLRNDTLIRETFIDILDGIYACHIRGVFHRDLKPENILCLEAGAGVQIADFGLATRRRLCKGFRCGTTYYMSPEQWADDVVYYPSLNDIWCLGIILLNMVTGRRPWNAARESDAHFRAFLEQEDYLYNTFPISRAVNELLKWILHPDPMDRLQIPQIRHAVLNIDTFYRIPGSSDNATFGWSKGIAAIRPCINGGRFDPQDESSDESENRRTGRSGCRPALRNQCFVHELLNSEELVDVDGLSS